MKQIYELSPIKRMRRREFLKGLLVGLVGGAAASFSLERLLSLFKNDEEEVINETKLEESQVKEDIKQNIEESEDKKPVELNSENIVEIVKKEIALNPKIIERDVWYLQVGSYKKIENAEMVLNRFKKLKYNGIIEERNGINRVMIRTFSKDLAKWLSSELKSTYGKTFYHKKKERWESYSRSDLEKIVEYFGEKSNGYFKEYGIDAKKLFVAIAKAESNIDPEKIAYKIREEIDYRTRYDKKTKKKVKEKIVNYSHETDGNGNKEVTAIGMMQIGIKNRWLFPFYLDEYFHPIKNAYMGFQLLIDAVSQVNVSDDVDKMIKDIAFIYNAGAANYKKWNFTPKKHQTIDFMERVLKFYKE